MLYRVLQPIHVPPGVVLTLDGAQARARSPWLRPLGPDTYQSAGMLCFKAGEIVGIDGDTPRAFAGRIQPVQPAVAGQAVSAATPETQRAPQDAAAAQAAGARARRSRSPRPEH